MAEKEYRINGKLVSRERYLEWQSLTPAERKAQSGGGEYVGKERPQAKEIAKQRVSSNPPVNPTEETESGTLEEFGDVIFGKKVRKKSPQYERIKRAIDIAKRRRGQ